jgi:hypothetical protein
MGPYAQFQLRLTPFATPLALQAPGDKLSTYSFVAPTDVLRVVLTVTTAITGVAAVLAIDKDPTYSAGTGRVEVVRLTLPVGTAIGKVVYSVPVKHRFVPGDGLITELITASTAGAAHVDLWYEQAWEQPLNLTSGVQSV